MHRLYEVEGKIKMFLTTECREYSYWSCGGFKLCSWGWAPLPTKTEKYPSPLTPKNTAPLPLFKKSLKYWRSFHPGFYFAGVFYKGGELSLIHISFIHHLTTICLYLDCK